jgi:hypothetical protein
VDLKQEGRKDGSPNSTPDFSGSPNNSPRSSGMGRIAAKSRAAADTQGPSSVSSGLGGNNGINIVI